MGDILDKANGKARKGDPVLSPSRFPVPGEGIAGCRFPDLRIIISTTPTHIRY